MKSLLPLIESKGIGDQVRSHLAPGIWTRIDEASRSEMLPAQMMIDLENAIIATVGEDDFVQFWHDYTLQSAGTVAIFKPLLEGLMRVFVGPKGVVRVLPRALAMTGKNVGDFTSKMHPDGQGAEFAYANLAPALRTPTFALATKGSLIGGFALVSVEATIEVDTTNLTSGELVLNARWEPSA